MTHRLAIYNFGIFIERAEHPSNDDWQIREDPIMDSVAQAPGFISRSGYEGDPERESWGIQVQPRFYEERGDGWSPATLSLWESVEALFDFTYQGLHKEAFALGKQWMVRGNWPPYVLWWVNHDHQPDWAEGVARFEHLYDRGPTAHAFNFKQAFGVDGLPLNLK